MLPRDSGRLVIVRRHRTNHTDGHGTEKQPGLLKAAKVIEVAERQRCSRRGDDRDHVTTKYGINRGLHPGVGDTLGP